MRSMVAVAGMVFALLASPSLVFAQHEDHGAPIAGRIPAEIIHRPLPLRDGIGIVHHATSAKSAEAQQFYEQGLAYLHSYVWLEAARSFNEALRRDASFALAWVGLSRALTGLEDHNAAVAAQKKAEALAASVTPRERKWIDARTAQLASLGDRQSVEKRDAYRAALDAALEQDSGDAELWTLRGNFEEPGLWAAGRGQRGSASAIAFYERAIALVPGHFGAQHYLIHTYEMIGRFDEAVKHGKIYAEAAPSVPHALHMYGHDLMKIGRTTEALGVFDRARRLEETYYESEKIARDYDWHHAHNTSLLAFSYRHEGQLRQAEGLMRQAAAVGQQNPSRQGYYKGVLVDFLIATGKLDEALASAKKMIEDQEATTRTLGQALAARALLAANQTTEARPFLDALPAASPGGYNGSQIDLARGEAALRGNDAQTGARLLEGLLARARQQRTPDGWIEGVFFIEAAFDVAMRTNQPTLAAKAAAMLMEHDAAYGGTHYAQGLIAERDGNRSAAVKSFQEAASLWKNADADFKPLVDSRRKSGTD
jgi:tetratricopeptide (TPR) repeat protein